MNSGRMRAWATPLTIGAFGLSAITGIMMFFHLELGPAKVLHEWFSWLLVIGGLFHVIGSWQPFVRHFSKPSPLAKTIMLTFAVLVVVSFIPISGDGNRKGVPPQKLAGLLSGTPFTAVAGIAAHEPEELVNELKSRGIVVDRKDATIQEIAARNGKRNVEILNMIF